MIVIQVPTPEQLTLVRAYCREHMLEDRWIDDGTRTMALMDGGAVRGVAAYQAVGSQGLLGLLHMAPDFRGLKMGDGLFRATLNLMSRSGVAVAFIPGTEGLKGFLEKEGIAPAEALPEVLQAVWGAPGPVWYAVEIEAFFNKPCKGGRHG